MGNGALVNINPHTAADLYTTGIRLLSVDIPDLTLLTGTGLHITEVPAENQVRELLMYDVAFMSNVSRETKPRSEHGEVTRQIVRSPGSDSRNSSAGLCDIVDEVSFDDGNRQNISTYTTDVRSLLLLCGDIESNPGPATTGLKPPPRNRRIARVSLDIFFFLQKCTC